MNSCPPGSHNRSSPGYDGRMRIVRVFKHDIGHEERCDVCHATYWQFYSRTHDLQPVRREEPEVETDRAMWSRSRRKAL